MRTALMYTVLLCGLSAISGSYFASESGYNWIMDDQPIDDPVTEEDFDEDFDKDNSPNVLRVIDVHSDVAVSPAIFRVDTIKKLLRSIKCVGKGKHACDVNCSQGKLLHRDGCCSCVCKKNFVTYGATSCKMASWSEWGEWTTCLKSKWGGLQTRERQCMSSGKQSPGACDGRGSMSKTCTMAYGAYKIRKNIRELTNEEVHDLIQAMTKFKKDTSKTGYRNIISWHGWPGRCPWYHKIHADNHCSWHHHPLFLPWHRMIMVQLEHGLGRYMRNKTLGIPFWDWTEHALDLPYLIRHEQIYDPLLKKYVTNPFHRNFIKYLNGKKIYSQRSPWLPGELMDRYMLQGTVRALLCHDYYEFDDQLALNPHDQIHNCFCVTDDLMYNRYRRCAYAMPTITYAAWDPVFMLHHSAIDRIFAMRRHLEEHANVSDWSRNRVEGEYVKGIERLYGASKSTVPHDVATSFHWPLSPFCNVSMNPLKETNQKDVWTLHKSYYYDQLFGYKFSNFHLGNYSWKNLLQDFKANVEDRKYWNDYYFNTKLGPLTKKNCKIDAKSGCVRTYNAQN